MTKKVRSLKTVGELKKALASIPDDTPLVIDDHSPGWGIMPPTIVTHSWQSDSHYGYCTAEEAKNMEKDPSRARPYKLDRPRCVIQPG